VAPILPSRDTGGATAINNNIGSLGVDCLAVFTPVPEPRWPQCWFLLPRKKAPGDSRLLKALSFSSIAWGCKYRGELWP